MSMPTSCVILTTILTFFSSAYAQTKGPHLHPLHEHWFFSAQTEHAGTQRVFYQVCNRSDGSSALKWHGAGFGITAFAELKSNFCAFKDIYNDAQYSPKAHKVEVQGKGPGSIITWSRDRSSKYKRWVYSLIETTFTKPAGKIQHSIISLRVDIEADGSGQLRISSSGNFADVVVRFPESEVDPNSVLNLATDNVDTRSTTLAEEDSSPSKDTLDLTEGDDRNAPAMLITSKKDGNFRASFKTKDLEQLGGTIKIYGRANNRLVIINDVPMPEKPS